MKIGITGGAGFIGSNVAFHFAKNGNEVRILDNFSRKGSAANVEWLQALLKNRVAFIKADTKKDFDALKNLAENSDILFHFAGQVAVTTSVQDPRDDFEANALGTFNVLEAVRHSTNRPVVIYSSTNKVYGKLADVRVEEGTDRYEMVDLKNGVPESMPLDFYSPYGC